MKKKPSSANFYNCLSIAIWMVCNEPVDRVATNQAKSMNLPRAFRLTVMSAAAMICLGAGASPSRAGGAIGQCTNDAMLVFDASGSMTSSAPGSLGFSSRLASVKAALSRVLPAVVPFRNLGLIVYGPGPFSCSNIDLRLTPSRNSAERIMSDIDRTVPAGRTPLTEAVRQAAVVLQYRKRPAVIVLLTDGEETCGGTPCEMVRSLVEAGHDITIHVISYAASNPTTTVSKSRCLAEATNGLFVSVDTTEQLVDALQKTLGCPQLSMRMP